MFTKLVVIEPVSLVPEAERALYQYAKEVVLYPDVPGSDEEIAARISGADADLTALRRWLDNPSNLFCCDLAGALGDPALMERENVLCINTSAGHTWEAFGLLSEKVLANIEVHLRGEAR